MICINGDRDWTDCCHSISQGLLVSFGYEPVVSDMSNRKPAVVVTGLGVLKYRSHSQRQAVDRSINFTFNFN